MPPRFAILEHDHPFLHWDLLLEVGDALWAWRLDAMPAIGPRLNATRLPDHRLLYLDYEGPIPGGRGVVQRWECGDYTWLDQTPIRLLLALRGSRCDCLLELGHTRGDAWEARFHPAG